MKAVILAGGYAGDVERVRAYRDLSRPEAWDFFRAQAASSMSETVVALEGQITRAQPYMQRTIAGEGGSQAEIAP